MRQLSVLLVVWATVVSCNDINNIVVTGHVMDEATGKPIPHAEVVILCWYNHNIDDVSFHKQTLTTDHEGKYEVKFKKGYQVDIASQAIGYQPNRSYHPLQSNAVEVNLKLSRIKNNPTLVAILPSVKVISVEREDIPFISVRIPATRKEDKLDVKNAKTFGFDFTTLKTNSDTTQADVWFKIENKEGYPKTLVTSFKGGLIPILVSDVKSSLLFEKAIAPTTDYLTTYTLTGSEAGFFVRCRDGKTYAKIILEKSAIEISSPDGQGGNYKEFRINFDCLYQPNATTDLTYSPSDINLEDFLVDFRLR
ncbi:MAG: hypothetical protein ACK5RG_15370 [Cyclobacteriaceae bacterium]|jgi:hypothetical protein|nr:carboxypeptidase-like regulatory domain-containing protein [Flammeovirgaceae bacterium]